MTLTSRSRGLSKEVLERVQVNTMFPVVVFPRLRGHYLKGGYDFPNAKTDDSESGAASAREMRAVMKIVVAKLKGEADGAVVNLIVRALLV